MIARAAGRLSRGLGRGGGTSLPGKVLLRLRPGAVAESDEVREGLILDYDKAGRLVSLELLDASEQVRQPQSVEFALAGAE